MRWLLILASVAIIFCVDGAAIAEVCDKFDETWQRGDPPLHYIPWTGWQILKSPFFVVLFVVSFCLAVQSVRSDWGRVPVFLLAIVWLVIGFFFLALVPMAEHPNDPAIRSALQEGCVSDARSGVELIVILFGMSGLLIYLGFRENTATV
jgi:hypothetical protein